jgi:LmbE family N-acetylglucosaminyl deacetylase
MMELALAPAGGLREILCLGAHADDIEIGCGATIRRLVAAHPDATVRWVVLSAPGERAAEAERSARHVLVRAGKPDVRVARFREGYFPWVGAEIKDWFEDLKREIDPEVIFTHGRGDLHQDHRIVSELTWNTFRHHLVLEYEIPKYDADRPDANVYVPLEASEVEEKAVSLHRFFPSQHHRSWFTPDTFRAVCALRGVECASPTGFAEAFVARKCQLHIPSSGPGWDDHDEEDHDARAAHR